MGGRGGAAAAADDEVRSTSVLSSRVRDVSKGSMPPFSDSLVKRSLRLQMYPEGVTTASVRGVRPVRAQVKVWLALELDAMVDLFVFVCWSCEGDRETKDKRERREDQIKDRRAR